MNLPWTVTYAFVAISAIEAARLGFKTTDRCCLISDSFTRSYLAAFVSIVYIVTQFYIRIEHRKSNSRSSQVANASLYELFVPTSSNGSQLVLIRSPGLQLVQISDDFSYIQGVFRLDSGWFMVSYIPLPTTPIRENFTDFGSIQKLLKTKSLGLQNTDNVGWSLNNQSQW